MAAGDFKTQVSRDENDNTASNVIFIQIADDGGNVASITGGALDVNATVTLETAYADNSTEFTIDSSDVNAQGYLVDDTATSNVTENNIGLARMTPNRLIMNVIVDPTTPSQQLVVNADGSINVVVAGASGAKVHDFLKTTDQANAATVNHDYTVVGGQVFSLKQLIVGSAGRVESILSVGPIAGLIQKAGFYTEKDSFADITFAETIDVDDTSTGTIRLANTNRSGATDVHSTIIGTTV